MTVIGKSYIYSGLTGSIIGAAMEVHGNLGAGFLESVYEESLAIELELQKIKFERQKGIDVYYKDRLVKHFVCDFIVEEKVIVEIKAIKQITEVERIQVINYLKASRFEVGLLINFGSKSLEFKRLINSNQ